MCGISIVPEGRMRSEVKELIGHDVCAEKVPFSFSHKGGDKTSCYGLHPKLVGENCILILAVAACMCT